MARAGSLPCGDEPHCGGGWAVGDRPRPRVPSGNRRAAARSSQTNERAPGSLAARDLLPRGALADAFPPGVDVLARPEQLVADAGCGEILEVRHEADLGER